MQIFRPIQHAITEEDKWVTVRELPVDYMGQLKCDGCHASAVVIENKSGEEEFVHSQHDMQEITKTRSCRYAIRTPASVRTPGTGTVMPRLVKVATPIAPIPPIGPRVLRGNTTARKWRCTWCGYRYYGNKQCSQCGEWLYALENDG